MAFNFNMRGRKTIRLKGRDYSAPGDYFITICTLNLECVFGKIHKGNMELSEAGKIICQKWQNTAEVRPSIVMGPFIIMPNHLHGVITIHTPRGDPALKIPDEGMGRPAGIPPISRASHRDAPTALQCIRAFQRKIPTLKPETIGSIIGQFKSISTKKIRASDLIAFHWQRNYYEHIIRSNPELEQVKKYILENPLKWPEDPDNPTNQ